jgi:hypothetical protein
MHAPVTFLATLLFASVAFAQGQRAQVPMPPSNTSISIERIEGAPVQVPLGFGIVLNKNSTLNREWFLVKDSLSPLVLDSVQGVNVTYKTGDRSSRGEYQYTLDYKVTPKEPITAFELRAIVIDVFGRQIRTLSATELVTLQEPRSFQGAWRIFSENEASEAFASLVYVAQVRSATGRVYVTNTLQVLEQARRVATRLTEADLEPKREAPGAR